MHSTKELAKELGLLKRKPRVENISDKAEGIAQLFSYLVVLDFESTCWQNDKFRSQEIIEFPAVLLNLKTGEIESEFHSYVQPQENPVLSQFCTQLTGISQLQVDDGIPLFICLKKFSAWLTQQMKSKKFSFPPSITDSNACFVTWSDWDLSVCLHYECKRKQLRRPPEMDYWIDLRASYRNFYDRRPNGLKGALQEVGIIFEGREHSGLHDSRNTAMLVKKMIVDGCKLKVTKSIQSSANIASLNNELWRSRAWQNSSLKIHQQRDVDESQHGQSGPRDQNFTDKSIFKVEGVKDDSVEGRWFDDYIDDSDLLLCSSFIESSSEIKDFETYSDVDLSIFSEEFEQDMDETTSSINLGTSSSSPSNGKIDELDIPHSKETEIKSCVSLPTVVEIKCQSPKSLGKLHFPPSIKYKDESNKENTVATGRDTGNGDSENSLRVPLSTFNENAIPRDNKSISKVSLTPVKTLTKSSLFTKSMPNKNHLENIPYDKTQPTPQGRLLFSSPMVSDKTPRQNDCYNTPINTFRVSSSSTPVSSPSSLMNRTPPLCGCGCRTKRKFVRNGGPNHGRTFFSCSKRRGCTFFEWEFKEYQFGINSSLNSSSNSFEISSSFVNMR